MGSTVGQLMPNTSNLRLIFLNVSLIQPCLHSDKVNMAWKEIVIPTLVTK